MVGGVIGVKTPAARLVVEAFRSDQDFVTIQHRTLEVKTARVMPLI